LERIRKINLACSVVRFVYMKKFTYAMSGVDILKEKKAVSALVNRITYTRKGAGTPITRIGHYAGLIEFGDYVLALTSDGVGSKILVADALQKWDTIGIDCVAMNVNDLLAMGVEPVAFSDYIAIDHPSVERMEQIGAGLERGAELSNITIVGGETATLPEIVRGFDLAGTCLGIALRNRVITGEKIEVGDLLIGLPSTGLHSNGYTLARKIIEESDYTYHDPLPRGSGKTIGEALLEPTKIYIEILNVLENVDAHGLAHITGGGLLKLHRLTEHGFNISNPIKPQPIFEFLQNLGSVENDEMYRTFNMGMGFLIVVPEEDAPITLRLEGAQIVGEVVKNGISIKGLELEP